MLDIRGDGAVPIEFRPSNFTHHPPTRAGKKEVRVMAMSTLIPPGLLARLAEVPSVGTLREFESTIGGFSNLSFVATTEAGVRVVVKATASDRKRADLRREQAMLQHLDDGESSGLTVGVKAPRVLATIDDDWVATVLAFIEGEPGLSAVQTREVPGLQTRVTLLARQLQAVHSTPLPTGHHPEFSIEDRMRSLVAIIETVGLHRAKLAEFVDAVTSPFLSSGMVLVHGDAGMHNTLWTGPQASVPTAREISGRRGLSLVPSVEPVRLASLLDWEWTGWGTPLLDISWLWWTLRFRHVPSIVFETFADAYGRLALQGMGWSPERVRILVRAQMINILTRSDPDSPAFGEWLTRIDRLPALRVPDLEEFDHTHDDEPA
jgi:aminoglycoside phosphotransferase (APT) family kinase protein